MSADSAHWALTADGWVPFGITGLSTVSLGGSVRLSPWWGITGRLDALQFAGLQQWELAANGVLKLSPMAALSFGSTLGILKAESADGTFSPTASQPSAQFSIAMWPHRNLECWAGLKGIGPRTEALKFLPVPPGIHAGLCFGQADGVQYTARAEVAEGRRADLAAGVRVPVGGQGGLMLGFSTRSQSIRGAFSYGFSNVRLLFALSYGTLLGPEPGFGASFHQP